MFNAGYCQSRITRGLLLLLVLPALFGGRTIARAETNLDPSTAALLYAGRLSDGNVESILDLFADDVSFLGGAPCNVTPCIGKTAPRARFETARATHVHLNLIKVDRTSPTTAKARGEQTSDVIRNCGARRLIVNLEVEVKGDKIVRLSNTQDLSDPETASFSACNAGGLGSPAPAAAAPTGALPVRPPATGDAGLMP